MILGRGAEALEAMSLREHFFFRLRKKIYRHTVISPSSVTCEEMFIPPSIVHAVWVPDENRRVLCEPESRDVHAESWHRVDRGSQLGHHSLEEANAVAVTAQDIFGGGPEG